MKKIGIFLTVVAMLACATVPVSADEVPSEREVCELSRLESTMTQEEIDLYNALSDMKAENGVMPAAEGGHTVRVTTPVDAQFRAKYSSWAWEVLRAVDDADDYLGEEFNINYYIVSNKLWDSAATTSLATLLDEAIAEWGLRDDASLMIAFTGRETDFGGMAYTSSDYCIIADQYRLANTLTVQHETGHCYGLEHCYSSASCIMCYAVTEDCLDNLDSSCWSLWNSRRLYH